MKKLIQYNSTVGQLFFKYLNGKIETFSLIAGLNFVQDHHRKETGTNGTLSFKFSEDDTMVTTIADLERDLADAKNREFTLERMRECTHLQGELIIYYS